jgi:hypothetical protein
MIVIAGAGIGGPHRPLVRRPVPVKFTARAAARDIDFRL